MNRTPTPAPAPFGSGTTAEVEVRLHGAWNFSPEGEELEVLVEAGSQMFDMLEDTVEESYQEDSARGRGVLWPWAVLEAGAGWEVGGSVPDIAAWCRVAFSPRESPRSLSLVPLIAVVHQAAEKLGRVTLSGISAEISEMPRISSHMVPKLRARYQQSEKWFAAGAQAPVGFTARIRECGGGSRQVTAESVMDGLRELNMDLFSFDSGQASRRAESHKSGTSSDLEILGTMPDDSWTAKSLVLEVVTAVLSQHQMEGAAQIEVTATPKQGF